MVGFITAFVGRASPLECLGFGLFCALPHVLSKSRKLRGLSHELVFFLALFFLSFFLKDVRKPDLTLPVPDFLPDSWWVPLTVRWEAVTAGAVFHLIMDLIAGHGITCFTRRIPALTKGNPWATVPSLIYVVTAGLSAVILNRMVPLVLAASTAEVVLGYELVFPPFFLLLMWLWVKTSWRYKALSPDGKIRIDIRELAKNWIESVSSPPESSSSETPKSEPAETVQTEQTEDSSGEPKAETPAERDFSDPWVTKIKKEYVEPYEELWKETRLEEVVERVLRMLDAEGEAPSVAGDRYDGEIKSQYDLLTRVSLSEHTYDVVRLAVKKLKSELPQGWQGIYPRLVLACLLHDIGKLPSVRGQNYVTGQHPVDGANLADLILKEADHPWREAVADLVRKHHERPGENASIEHRILVWADKEARLEETTALAEKIRPTDRKKAEKTTAPVPTVVASREPPKKGKPETRPIPSDFPLSPVFQKILEQTNKLIKGRVWVAFSQPDGNVYVYPETLHKAISDTAREAGFEDPFFHSAEEKRNSLQSFYDEFRRRGWVPEKLVSKDFYGNFFRLWNPMKPGFTCTFYVPIKVSAFEVPLGKLEKIRKEDPVLSQVKIFGVAPACDLRGKCDGKCPFGK